MMVLGYILLFIGLPFHIIRKIDRLSLNKKEQIRGALYTVLYLYLGWQIVRWCIRDPSWRGWDIISILVWFLALGTLASILIGIICMLYNMVIHIIFLLISILAVGDIIYRQGVSLIGKNKWNKKIRKKANDSCKNNKRYNYDHQYREQSRTHHQAGGTENKYEKALLLFSLNPGYTLDELKRKRNELLKKYHPDEGEGNVKITQQVNEYYELLKRIRT